VSVTQRSQAKARDNRETKEPEFDPAAVSAQLDRIEAGLLRIRHGGLNERAIVALIHDHTKIGKRQIEDVLRSLLRLRARYTMLLKGKTK
jgi:hypothetical protein